MKPNDDGWTFRELMVLGMIRAAGHDVRKDRVDRMGSHGWATCAKCGVTWWITKRAEVADGGPPPEMMAGRFEKPLQFSPCTSDN